MKFTLRNGPLPEHWYGSLSPLRATNNMVIELPCEEEPLKKLLNKGIIPDPIPQEWYHLHQYLDIPMLAHLSNYATDIDQWDMYLWLHKLKKTKLDMFMAARHGQLETLKWIYEMSSYNDKLSQVVDADGAVENGHLETVKMVT